MTDDEIIATMFDEVKAVNVPADVEFAAACEAMVETERRFQRLDRMANPKWADPKADPAPMCEYFDALESRYLTDKRLWELFTAGDRSVRSNRAYNEFRLVLLRSGSTKADA